MTYIVDKIVVRTKAQHFSISSRSQTGSSFNVFLYKIYDLMSTIAELWQYFLCKHD